MQLPSTQDAQILIQICPHPTLVLTRDGRIDYGNQALADLIAPIALSGLLGRQPRLVDEPSVATLLAGAPHVEWQDTTGKTRHFNLTVIELPDGREARFYVDCTTEMELRASNRRLAEELRNTTLTDPATGLLNERGVSLALEPQIARCRRYNSPLSVVGMQIDAPAPHNEVLLEVARLLKDQLRWADLIGCSERKLFLLVLPETTEDAAMQLTGKLRSLLAELGSSIFDGIAIPSTYGLAGWRKSDTAATLIARATGALNEAKSADKAEVLAL